MSDIKEIIFEDINDDYGYGKYGEFEVIINKKTGYINATKLCKDGGKEFRKFFQYDHGKRLLETFSYQSGRNRTDLIIKITDVPNHLKGTYVHPQTNSPYRILGFSRICSKGFRYS